VSPDPCLRLLFAGERLVSTFITRIYLLSRSGQKTARKSSTFRAPSDSSDDFSESDYSDDDDSSSGSGSSSESPESDSSEHAETSVSPPYVQVLFLDLNLR
jgi:hypothetical protein